MLPFCVHSLSRPSPLPSGATGRVGDPSGKSSERPVLDDATLEANTAGIRAILEQLLGVEAGAPAIPGEGP